MRSSLPPGGELPCSIDEEFVRLHYQRLYRLCCVLLSDRHEAEDVTQEVFLKAHEQRLSSPVTNWSAWLTRVAINAVRDRRRVGWWPRWRKSTVEIGDADLPSGEAMPDQVFVGADVRDRVWRAFAGLSARQREVFALRQIEGWSTEAVASALRMHPGTVKRHLFRAVHALRRAVDVTERG